MYQTAQPHVYAVATRLVIRAWHQRPITRAHCREAPAKGEATAHLIEDIPTGIYTIPEISSVGKTEQQLTAMKMPYEVGRAQFKHLARAQIVGMNVGTLKILFHRETKEMRESLLWPARCRNYSYRSGDYRTERCATPSSTSSTPPLTTRRWRKPIG